MIIARLRIIPSSLFCLFPPVCPRHLRSRILFWATLSQLIIFSVTVAVQESRGWEPFPSGMKDGFEFKVIPGADNNNWYKAYYKCQNETVNTGELVTLENINSLSQSPFDFLMERVRKQFGTGSPSGFYVNAHKFLFGSLPSWSSGSWATAPTSSDEMACYCVKTDGILYNLSCGEISSEMVTVCQRKKLNREQKIGFVATENPANWAGTRGRASWLMGKMSIMNSPCWYLRLEGKRNWYEGVRDCNRLGSQLLSITESDTSEFNELETKFDSDSPTIFVNSHRYLYGWDGAPLSSIRGGHGAEIKKGIADLVHLDAPDKNCLILVKLGQYYQFQGKMCSAKQAPTICKSCGSQEAPDVALARAFHTTTSSPKWSTSRSDGGVFLIPEIRPPCPQQNIVNTVDYENKSACPTCPANNCSLQCGDGPPATSGSDSHDSTVMTLKIVVWVVGGVGSQQSGTSTACFHRGARQALAPDKLVRRLRHLLAASAPQWARLPGAFGAAP